MSIHIGDFVTAYGAGYWQLIDIKPKIASFDYSNGEVSWKKGDRIGQWVILKKAFTPKMKPRIDFTCEDSAWLRPVSGAVFEEIQRYFAEHPDYKAKFDQAEVKLRPSITNCWINLTEEEAQQIREVIRKMPDRFTMEQFWKKAKKLQKNVSNPPTYYLLNFLAYVWELDKKANQLFFDCEVREVSR